MCSGEDWYMTHMIALRIRCQRTREKIGIATRNNYCVVDARNGWFEVENPGTNGLSQWVQESWANAKIPEQDVMAVSAGTIEKIWRCQNERSCIGPCSQGEENEFAFKRRNGNCIPCN